MLAAFRSVAPAAVLAFALGACETQEPIPPPPTAEEIRGHYDYAGELDVSMSGNVAQVSVVFDPAQYERGGDLWAKAFPYIFLFSPATRDALGEHRGLGGVRVISLHPNGDTIAQALLERGALTELTWRRAINVAGEARRDGTERPARMQDLVEWGEDHTRFEYNPNHIRRP